jgi:hypothetical protein
LKFNIIEETETRYHMKYIKWLMMAKK